MRNCSAVFDKKVNSFFALKIFLRVMLFLLARDGGRKSKSVLIRIRKRIV